jgi:beta-xylosidase
LCQPSGRTAFYAEFGSTGDGAPAGARVPWAHALTAAEAEAFTPAAVLGGKDGWAPQPAPTVAPWMPDAGDGTYRNPVIDADYSDPDAVRVEDDYWMTSSSFGHVPGLPILHSRDLVNWRIVAHALPRLVPGSAFAAPQHGKGVWAPALRHHAGRFWLYYPDPDFGIHLVTAADPRGPWSEPVLVKAGKGLIDPAPLWDEDGKVYLIHAWAKSRAGFNNVLTLLRLDSTGTRVEEDLGVVIDGNKLPGYTTLEGPKLYRRNGWYYVFAPAGGVKPGWQSVFRSRSIRGPYEERIVLDQGVSPVNGPHQGALVDTPGGEWWFLHFQDKEASGRVVHLQPVVWREDWPVIGADPDGDGRGQPVLRFRKPALPVQPAAAPEAGDEFDGPKASLAWQWQANPLPEWAEVKGGALHLSPVPAARPNLWAAPHLLLQKFPAGSFSVTTRLQAGQGSRAGLVVFGTDYAWLGLEHVAGRSRLVLKRCLGADAEAAETELAAAEWNGNPVELRVQVGPEGRCRFSYRIGEGPFNPLPGEFTARAGRWVGAKVGLFCEAMEKDAGAAAVEWFRIGGETP